MEPYAHVIHRRRWEDDAVASGAPEPQDQLVDFRSGQRVSDVAAHAAVLLAAGSPFRTQFRLMDIETERDPEDPTKFIFRAKAQVFVPVIRVNFIIGPNPPVLNPPRADVMCELNRDRLYEEVLAKYKPGPLVDAFRVAVSVGSAVPNRGSILLKADSSIPQGNVLIVRSGSHPSYWGVKPPVCQADVDDIMRLDPFAAELHLHPQDLSTYNKTHYAAHRVVLNPVTSSETVVPTAVVPRIRACECGSEKTGLPTHSSWCPRGKP